ncbi:MAG: ATP-dependent helicase [Planctomycetes bacterium]|nr:ATP-dependent helicase [Planctomycetota bacterium]
MSRSNAYLAAAEELRENSGQWAAYESEGNCVVLAGPGSGKTKTLTVKVAQLLSAEVRPPRGLACVTYSSECSRELTRRLDKLGVRSGRNTFVGTVHSFCLTHILRPYAHLTESRLPQPYRVCTQEERADLFRRAVDEVISVDEEAYKFNTLVDVHRRTVFDRASWQTDRIGRLADRFEQLLRKTGLIDFDDMVLIGLELLGNDWLCKALVARFPILVVDEYQDLGEPLHRIVLRLLGFGMRIFAVGDPDQSIYGFTGARPELLRELSERKDLESVRLMLNYRCGQKIIQAATLTLAEEREYKPGNDHEGAIYIWKPDGGLEGQVELIFSDLLPKARERRSDLRLSEVAILYHTKSHGTEIAAAAEAADLSYIRIDGLAPYRKTALTRWVEDCASWCAGGWQLGEPRLGPLLSRWLSWHRELGLTAAKVVELKRRVVRYMFEHREPREPVSEWLEGLYAATLHTPLRLESMAHEMPTFLTMLKAFSDKGPFAGHTLEMLAGQTGREDHLNLITLHSVKGREFDVVFMVNCDDWQFRVGNVQSNNLFYVGMTRARHEIHFLCSDFAITPWGARKPRRPAKQLYAIARQLEGS